MWIFYLCTFVHIPILVHIPPVTFFIQEVFMTFDTFKETIVSALSDYYGSDYILSIQEIPKNNHITLEGLTIQKKGHNISPTIYLNPYFAKFQNGMPMFFILEQIKNTYAMHHPGDHVDIRFFTDYENAKDRICMKLIHYEKNRELLKEVPHIRFLDLAVVFYYLIQLPSGEQATILIYNKHLPYWNVTTDTLFESAKINTPKLLPYYFDDVFSILRNVSDLAEFSKEQMSPLYVLTNSEKLFGAAVILYPDLLSSIAKKINHDLIIIPSSLHEVLLLPADQGESFEEYAPIIREVNHSELLPEEVLSDHAYYYSRKTDSIC